MRADIHDGPEQTLQSEAGYSNARPHRQDRRNLLHRTAGPYIRVIHVAVIQRRAVIHVRSASDSDRFLCEARNDATGQLLTHALQQYGGHATLFCYSTRTGSAKEKVEP